MFHKLHVLGMNDDYQYIETQLFLFVFPTSQVFSRNAVVAIQLQKLLHVVKNFGAIYIV